MSGLSSLFSWWNKSGRPASVPMQEVLAQVAEEADEQETETVDFSDTESGRAVMAELERQKKELDRLRREQKEKAEAEIEDDAILFAQHHLEGKRAVPAERENMIALYRMAAFDDLASPKKITFSTGTEHRQGSRVEALEALYKGRPQHALFQEQIISLPEGSQVLPQAGVKTNGKMTAERKRELMGMTDTGRAYLAKHPELNG